MLGGDIIIAAEGGAPTYDYKSYEALMHKLNEKVQGARIDITVLRADKEIQLYTTK